MPRALLAILSCIVTLVLSQRTFAQTIDISLNLHYNDSANPALGGSWTMVAKTNGVNGIAGIDALISNINVGGVAYHPSIGAYNFGGTGTVGSAVEILYFQDLSTPANVVTNVGRGPGTPGNLPFDQLNDPAWNNAAQIATGTFGPNHPAFTSVGPQSTDGNVLSSASPPFSVLDAAVTTIVRDAIVGDYNRNGSVDAADYVVWRKTFGAAGPNLPADGSGNNVVDVDDYNAWRRGFGLSGGASPGAGSGSGATSTVPEPATILTVLLTLVLGVLFKRRARSCNAIYRITTPVLLIALAMCTAQPAQALPRTWIGGNVDWIDGGAAANWSPADEPDADDEAIFNTSNVVNLGSNNSIIALTMSNGIDLNTNNFDLDVNGLVQLVDANTNLFVGAAASLLTADSITINNGADVELNGGTLQINEEAGNGLVDINAGGELAGHGTLSMTDSFAGVTTLIINDGAITARRDPLVIFGAPQVGTLSMNVTDLETRIDLDGAGETGDVNVLRNQTLDINMVLADAFNGAMLLNQNATIEMFNAWNLGAGGIINADNGFIPGVFPNPDVPAGISTIAGPTLSVSGGTINVVDTDGTLEFDASFLMNTGTFNNEGHTIFNNAATINNGSTFNMGLSGSDLTVGANANVTFHQPSFNLDGNAAGTVITVNQDGLLTLDLGDYDNDAATNAFNATINIDGGEFNVNTADLEFVMDGVLNMHSTSFGLAILSGEPIDIGNDAGVLNADLNVTGESFASANVAASVDFNSDADVNIAAGGTLQFVTSSTVNFDTVNGGNNAEFTGSGRIFFNGTVNVNEAVTFNMVGGTVDLDGNDGTGEFINVDAPFTINAATMNSFGAVNGVGTNTLDINNNVATGVLTVNLDDADSEWTLNGPGVMNLINNATAATLLAGSDVNINGTVNVTGDVRVTARLDVAGVVNINTAAEPLRLAGGNNTDDPNTIAGGTISGVGLLAADDGKLLQGFGTINTGIDFDGSATFRADDGTLTINGTIADVGTIGTADDDGILHVTNAWNNNVTTGIQLHGGTLSGDTITNDATAGISGHGLVTARVINNTQLFASLGDTLIVETPGNDNDWDGTTNTGEIEATQADIELRDIGIAFGFTGTVRATNGHTAFTNGFALDFNPGSTLNLAGGGTYRSTASTDIGGNVIVAVSESTIEVENNVFLSFEPGSTTTLGANLRLKNNNIIIEDGATFSGAGALIIPDGSHVVAENLADIGVLLDMQGGFRPGNNNGIARVGLFDYQQADSTELFVELTGTALNAFDRLVASGDVIVDGFLSIDIDDISPGVPFVPALGNTFNIITGNSVTGQFDYADVSGMPAGLAFAINYLGNAVQLEVVPKPFFEADFDDDGDVDKTDLVIWDGAYDLNQLGDADGDNDSDGADVLIWQRQFGSHPVSGSGAGAEAGVPEPASLTLLLIAYLACAQVARRHRSNAAR